MSRNVAHPRISDEVRSKLRNLLVLGFVLAAALAGSVTILVGGCGGGSSSSTTPDPPPAMADPQPLQPGDVQNAIQKAVNSENIDMVVAVVDRAGIVLGVYRTGV